MRVFYRVGGDVGDGCFESSGEVCLVWEASRMAPVFKRLTQSPFSNPTTTTSMANTMTPIQRRGYRALLNPFRSIQSVEYRRHSHLRGPRQTPAHRPSTATTPSQPGTRQTLTSIQDILQRSTESILAGLRCLTSSGCLWRARRGYCNLSRATQDVVRLRHRSSRHTPPPSLTRTLTPT